MVSKRNSKKIPRHIAIIPDGNRTWARKNNTSLEEAYEKGIRKIGDVAKWCRKHKIKMLTMWGFSTENFQRDRNEVEKLFSLFRKFLFEGLERMDRETRKEKNEVKVRFFGRIELLPDEIQRMIREVERRTEKNKPYQLNLLLAYGGQAEIVDGVNRAIRGGIRKVDEKSFLKFLPTGELPPVDLVIRTSGAKRLSGFMPWHTAYSEFYFCDTLWPDFSRRDFENALKEYAKRMRKFGR
ncbi:MAG: polyprenyl diphosphate synthase [Candidatus Anstonellales archaeon]